MDTLFHDYNGDKLVDVNCGTMLPSGNLNVNQPGSYAAMRKELDKAYAGNNTFTSSTTNGFKPGYTIKGLEGNWGTMTISK